MDFSYVFQLFVPYMWRCVMTVALSWVEHFMLLNAQRPMSVLCLHLPQYWHII